MNKMKKMIGLLGLMAACFIGGVAFTGSVSANATTVIPEQGQMEGASIRYSKAGEDANRTGMRFVYRLDKETSNIAADFSNIENMGLLLAQTSTLDGAALTVDTAASNTKYYENGQKVEGVAGNTINVGNYVDGRFVLDEEGDSYVLMVYIYNIPKASYNTEFTSVGYVQLDGQSTVTYTNSVSRSVSYVAKQAYYANDYENDTQKTWLENCLNKYTVTFNTGDGEAVEAVEVFEDGTLDKDLVSSLDGYTFAGWTKNGTAVDLNTFKVTESCTLDANFKKTVSEEKVLNLGSELTLDAQTVTKITVNGQEIASELYSSTESGVTLAASAFTAAGQTTVKVYQSEYVYTEYTVIVLADVVAFSEIGENYVIPVYNGNSTNAKANFDIVSNPAGMEGDFYKLTFGTNQEAGLKIKPTLTKEQIKNYYSEYSLVFNYYIAGTNATKVNILYNGAYNRGIDANDDGVSDSSWSSGKRSAYSDTYNQGVWNTAVVPVSDILAYEDEYDNATGQFTGNKTDVTILDRMCASDNGNCTGQLIYFDYSATAGEFYAGNFNLVKNVNVIGLEDGKATPTVVAGSASVAMGEDYTFNPDVMDMDIEGLTLSYWVDGVKNADNVISFAGEIGGYQTTLTVVASDQNGILQTLYTETITVVDTSVPLAWNVLPTHDATTGLITSNAIFKHTYNTGSDIGAYGYWTNNSYIVDDSQVPEGTNKTGSFYKVTRTSDQVFDGFKLKTNLTKAQLELYKDKYLQFDLYFNITPTVSQDFKLGFMHNGTSFYEEVDYKGNGLMGTWQTVQIPVTYIIENYDAFSTLSADNSLAGNIVIMTKPTNSASYTIEYYMSAPIVADYDISVALSWNDVKFAQGTAHVIRQTGADEYYHVADWQNQSAFNGGVFSGDVGSVVTAADVPEGSENTGSFYKIQFTRAGNVGANTGYGLKVKLNIDKETLSLYKNGYLTFDIYAGITADNADQLTGVGISYMGLGNNSYLLPSGEAANEWSAINEWHTVKISVQQILDNYDVFASGEWKNSYQDGQPTTYYDNGGAIFVVHVPNAGWSATELTTANIYVSELKIGA